MNRFSYVVLLGMCIGCAATDNAEDTGGAQPAARITAPVEGASLERGAVVIRLTSDNIAIVPAGTIQPNSGHLHLFLDRALTPVGEVIPTENGIVHLGKGQTEHNFENLGPGQYRVIAAFGDYQHVLMGDVVADTVVFAVR